jgi:MFS family permease
MTTRQAGTGLAAEDTDGHRVWPAITVFLLNGLTLSTYIVRLPALKHELGLSDAEIGVVGVVFALSALAAMQGIGALVRRFGSAAVLRTSLVGMPALLALVGLADSMVVLCLAAAALGAAHGTTDAAMNTHAVAVEREAGHPILNRCHAAWSVSAVFASLTSAGLAHLGVSTPVYVVSTALVLLICGLLLGPVLRTPGSIADPSPGTHTRLSWRDGWSRPLVVLGLSGTLLMVCEGAALGWGVLLLRDAKGAPLGVATLAVTAYTGAQTVSRLLGDRSTLRYGAPRVYRASVLLGAAGLAAAVLAPAPWLGIVGFAVMGLGMATPLPLTFSAIGATSPARELAPAVARFTTFTYGGILLGPALVGGAAELVGLAPAIGGLAAALLALGLTYRLPTS